MLSGRATTNEGPHDLNGEHDEEDGDTSVDAVHGKPDPSTNPTHPLAYASPPRVPLRDGGPRGGPMRAQRRGTAMPLAPYGAQKMHGGTSNHNNLVWGRP